MLKCDDACIAKLWRESLDPFVNLACCIVLSLKNNNTGCPKAKSNKTKSNSSSKPNIFWEASAHAIASHLDDPNFMFMQHFLWKTLASMHFYLERAVFIGYLWLITLPSEDVSQSQPTITSISFLLSAERCPRNCVLHIVMTRCILQKMISGRFLHNSACRCVC